MAIGEMNDSTCTTGSGNCIVRSISKWDISAVTDIPPDSQITGASIKLMYSTAGNGGGGSRSPGTVMQISIEPPGTSVTTPSTLDVAFDDAGQDDGTSFISSWDPNANTNFNCIVATCPTLSGAVADFRNRQTGSWYAVGFESDDANWDSDNWYRTINGLGYTGSNQKPKLKISYTCNNGSLNPGCT
jgi:hypothetical protein